MEQKNIPILNEKFDFNIFIQVFKRNIILSILIFIAAGFGAFAYLRYTQPVYKSSSIVQLKNENTAANKVLNLTTAVEEINSMQTIELIRSKEFLKRTFNKMPLGISYYSQGTFLENELYRATPFTIDFRILKGNLYNTPISISFSSDGHAIVRYAINNANIEKELQPNTWKDIGGFEINLNINDLAAIRAQTEKIKNESYYFTINDTESVYKKYSSQLDVTLLNAEANTIQISFTDNNAQKTSEMVNTIAEEFIKYDVEKKKESSQKILDFIEIQNDLIYQQLDSIEGLLMQFGVKNQVRSDKENGGSGVDRYASLLSKIEEDIDNVEVDISSLKQVLDEIAKAPNIKVYDLISLLPSKDDGILISLLNQMQNLISQRDIYLNNQTQNSFQIKVIEKQIETQKQTLIDLIKSNYNRAIDKRLTLIKKLAEYEIKVYGNTSALDLDFLKIKRLYTINEEFYNKLLEKKSEYLISQAGSISQNTILEKSVVPNAPISPIRNSILILFMVVALVLTASIIILRYLLYNQITSPEDVRSYSEVPVVGVVPLYKTKLPVSQLLVDVKPNSVFSESFRSIKSSIDFLKNIEGPKTIAVSSTISGEGKTFVALNLAGIYAIQGKKVILLDLDLRKPRFHLCFNTDNSKGLSTILIKKNTVEECIRKSKISNLDYITAGPVPPNPSELTASIELTKLIAKLKPIYDVIIIDTPPLGLVTDALEIFKTCDYPIYVIKANYSKRAFLYNLNHLFTEKHILNLSVVINGIDLEKSRYGGYNYGYGYGYGYGNTDYHTDYYDDSEKKKKQGLIGKIISKL
jgi:capsular exopolysaccharide synthesis family protein